MSFERRKMGVEYSSEVIERARKLRAIDDVLFRLIASRTDVCQEIIQTMLGDNTIKVIKVTPQATMISLFREVVLDGFRHFVKHLSFTKTQRKDVRLCVR